VLPECAFILPDFAGNYEEGHGSRDHYAGRRAIKKPLPSKEDSGRRWPIIATVGRSSI
jgi:hypothetical protein